MTFKAVLFDLDGTLLDTVEDLADSMNSVLECHSLPVHPVSSYKYFVGDGMETLVERTLPQDKRSGENIKKLLLEMREEYQKMWKIKTKPYPEIPELLETLTSMKIPFSVLSNKPDDFTGMVLHHFFPQFPFKIVRGQRKDTPKKPHPAGALFIAHELNLHPSEFIYLGDTNTDMQTAISAGMYPAGALWGFRTVEELTESGAKVLIEKPMDFINLFNP